MDNLDKTLMAHKLDVRGYEQSDGKLSASDLHKIADAAGVSEKVRGSGCFGAIASAALLVVALAVGVLS